MPPLLTFGKEIMDPNAKRIFQSGCMAALFAIGAILAACWLGMIEFGASFHETQQDRIFRIIAWVLIIVLTSAFIVTCVMTRFKRRSESHAESAHNPDLDGTPWANNPGFRFDADNPYQKHQKPNKPRHDNPS